MLFNFNNKHLKNQKLLTKQVNDYYSKCINDRNLQQSNDGYVHHHYGIGGKNKKLKSQENISNEIQKQETNTSFKIMKLLDLKNKKNNIVDIGCGRGGNLFFISDYNIKSKLTGLNINNYQIEFCKNEINKKDLKKRINIKKQDFLKNWKLNNVFTHAYSCEVTQYVLNLNDLFVNVNKSLKKNGIFVIVTWCYNEKENRSKLKKIIEPINEHYKSNMHSLKYYKNSLKKSGFKILKCEDKTKDVVLYWKLRKLWKKQSVIEDYFLKGHKNRSLLYYFIKAKKIK